MSYPYLSRIFGISALLISNVLSSTVITSAIVFRIGLFKLHKTSDTKLSTTTPKMSTTTNEFDDNSNYETFNFGIAFTFGFIAVVLCLLCCGFNIFTRCICSRFCFSTNVRSRRDSPVNTTQNGVNSTVGAFVITYPDQPPPSYGEISKGHESIPSSFDNENPTPAYNDLVFLTIDRKV